MTFTSHPVSIDCWYGNARNSLCIWRGFLLVAPQIQSPLWPCLTQPKAAALSRFISALVMLGGGGVSIGFCWGSVAWHPERRLRRRLISGRNIHGWRVEGLAPLLSWRATSEARALISPAPLYAADISDLLRLRIFEIWFWFIYRLKMKWMRWIRRNFKSWKQNLVKATIRRFRSLESILSDFHPPVLLFKKHKWFNCALKQLLNCIVQTCILEVLLQKAIFFNSSCICYRPFVALTAN